MKHTGIKTEKTWVKNIALFITSQSISLFGSSLVQFAIIWYITLKTGSGIMLTISTICGFVPQLLISLFAGVWADRYDRKKLIVVSDGLIACSTLLLAILFLSGMKEIWLLFVVSAVRSFGQGVQTPATNAMIPQIVPEDQLMRINGINQTINSIMLILSPAAGGAIFGLIGIEMVFFIDVITAAIGISVMLCIPIQVKAQSDAPKSESVIQDIMIGVRYIKKSTLIATIVIYCALLNILVTPAANLSPLLITRVFDEEVWRLTVNEISFSIGTVFGGLIIAAWGGFRNRLATSACSICAFGGFTALIGLTANFPIYIALIVASGIMVPILNSPTIALLQERVDNEMQGRVFSFLQIASSSAMPLGTLIFGLLSDYMNIQHLFVLTGVLLAVLGISMFYTKAMQEYKQTIKGAKKQSQAVQESLG
jgi:DHA3 family macrolide efflux protein-like MFS transporter